MNLAALPTRLEDLFTLTWETDLLAYLDSDSLDRDAEHEGDTKFHDLFEEHFFPQFPGDLFADFAFARLRGGDNERSTLLLFVLLRVIVEEAVVESNSPGLPDDPWSRWFRRFADHAGERFPVLSHGLSSESARVRVECARFLGLCGVGLAKYWWSRNMLPRSRAHLERALAQVAPQIREYAAASIFRNRWHDWRTDVLGWTGIAEAASACGAASWVDRIPADPDGG